MPKIEITGDNKGFVSTLQDSKKKLATTFQGVQAGSLGGLLSASIWGTVATLGIQAIQRINDAWKEWRANAAQALALNIDYSELKKLQEIALYSITPIETITASTAKMEDALLKAKLGNQDAIDSFRALGLEMDKMGKLTPNEQLLAVLRAIRSIKDENVKGAVASQFGLTPDQVEDLFKSMKIPGGYQRTEEEKGVLGDIQRWINLFTGKTKRRIDEENKPIGFTAEQQKAQEALAKKFAGVGVRDAGIGFTAAPVDQMRRIGAHSPNQQDIGLRTAQQQAFESVKALLPEIVELLRKDNANQPQPKF
jgi:hypothetical protein